MAIVLNGTSGAQIPLGTAAAPSATNTTAQATGLYFPSSTTLGLSTNGTAALTIDASQNVGIGTTSPGQKLEVRGGLNVGYSSGQGVYFQNSDGTNNYEIYNVGATGAGNPVLSFYQTGTGERMRIDSSGNVGIGTNSPANNAGYQTLTINGTSGGVAQIQVAGTNTFQIFSNATANYLNGQTALPMAFYTNATERMRIDSSGNVGVGTSSPGFKLEVVSSYNNGLQVKDTTGTVYGGWFTESVGMALVTRSNHQLRFATNDSTRMTISAAGNVGIGFDAQASLRLFVKGSDSTLSNYTIYAQNSSSADLFYVRNDGFFSTGNVGSSPYNATTATAANVVVASNGQLQRSTSSLKYKTDVKDSTHGLAEVLQLRPVTYKGKNDGDTVFGGLIAEEVDAVGLTEFVQYAEDGSPDALAYGNMVSLLVKAIQELKAELDALKGTK